MLKKIVTGTVLTVLTLLLISIVAVAVNVQSAKGWSGTVYIRADGSIDPSDAPIITYDNVTYTLTDNITSPGGDGIVVERDNIIIDGKGFTIEGWRVYPPKGIYLSNRVNVTIQDTRIEGFCYGIYLDYSSNNSIVRNNMTKSLYNGITLWDSSNYNSIVGNNITAIDYDGVYIADSSNNIICRNRIANNWYGVYLWGNSSNNIIYHNNFIDTGPSIGSLGYVNAWDNGYPAGGNFWSNYAGVDEKSGSYQNQSGSDGIGDTPHFPVPSNMEDSDNYPLMGPINIFEAGTWDETEYFVDVVSNSTISDFYFDPDEGAFLRFNVTGEDGTGGFCRITISKNLLWVEDGWAIIVGDQQITDYTLIPDEDFTYLYFTFSHSTKTVTIQGTHVIPEFRSAIIMPLFIVLTMLAVVFAKRRTARKPKF